jgi:hypothetical protein
MRAGTTPTLARPSHNGIYSILFSMNRATVSPFLYIKIFFKLKSLTWL